VTGPMDGDRRGRPIKRQCTGHRKDGARCRRPANRGATVCNSHGGAAGQVRAAAARRQAEAAAAAVLDRWHPPNGDGSVVDVLGELARLAERLISQSDYLTGHLAAMDPAEWAAPSDLTEAKVRMWHVTAAQTASLLTSIARLGVDLDRESMARRTGDWCYAVVSTVFDRFGFPHRREDVRVVVAEVARATPANPGPRMLP
jgi:hypothetical protein